MRTTNLMLIVIVGSVVAGCSTQTRDGAPIPGRVIYQQQFQMAHASEELGAFDVVASPQDRRDRMGRAIPHKNTSTQWIRLRIEPHPRVGETTMLRFRYFLTGTSTMTVQIFDLTDMDNRHIRMTDLPQSSWQTVTLNFTTDARRNDGTDTPFAAGHKVDDIFFFVKPETDQPVELLIDQVVLYDASERP